jgi:hypothetical protein
MVHLAHQLEGLVFFQICSFHGQISRWEAGQWRAGPHRI